MNEVEAMCGIKKREKKREKKEKKDEFDRGRMGYLDVVQGSPGRVAAVKVEHSCVSWGGGLRDWLGQE